MEYILCLYLASPRMKPHHNGWMSPMSKYAITFVAVNQHIPFHLSQLLCCFWHLHHLYKCYNLHNPLLYYSTWFHLQMIQTQIKLIWAKTKKEEEYIVLCSEMLCSQSGTSCTQQVKCSHSLFNSHLCSLNAPRRTDSWPRMCGRVPSKHVDTGPRKCEHIASQALELNKSCFLLCM